ncbi:GNAT family N-acetyltransferase [Bradyrhizobium sp. LHD-71]|uniref:GNAT family N-acetyltransferase n=1 Tax=Bradyrhizobium sp. LHD-71 TaxID=3072141 RepID=UPI00280D9824|nr:GNAT family N-acetyltransferase [Bradyrhizobium sp. LHD-71]MDQ8726271.1 GNAT family N-acetyltransferase [Bradyrhizobium sp. LHD-71]
MPPSQIEFQAVPSIDDIPAEAWDACANPAVGTDANISAGGSPCTARERYNPFVRHAFYHALEASRSACPRTGWGPQHLIARRGSDIVGVVPCYLKSHSRGEYVFDHGWADAYERAGGRYYPKLQVSVPFTPASGPRLLVREGAADTTAVRDLLAKGLMALCRTVKASSVHVTFTRKDEWELLAKNGFLQRTDKQFHWENQGYCSFEDFLGALNSRHRKQVKRERREAVANGITIEHLTGKDLNEAAFDAFFRFYMETGSRKWGSPYLTREFYSRVAESMPDDILLVMARRNGRWIAGAINFIGSETLFGRHWGAIEHHPFLHFEVCYYQAIEFAIRRGLKRVEAGAQGEHKLARGYLPTETFSAHYIPDPGFRHAVAGYLKRERQYVSHAVDELTEYAPFRKATDSSDEA